MNIILNNSSLISSNNDQIILPKNTNHRPTQKSYLIISFVVNKKIPRLYYYSQPHVNG